MVDESAQIRYPDRRLHHESSLEMVAYPHYIYPGDEITTSEQYVSAMQNWYVFVGGHIRAGAEGVGLVVAPEQAERLKRTASAAFWLDYFLDESDDKKSSLQLYLEGVDSVRNGVPAPELPLTSPPEIKWSIELLKNSSTGLDQEVLGIMLDAAQRIGEISLEKAGISEVVMYKKVLAEEGVLTGRLLGLSLLGDSPDTTRSGQYIKWLENGIAAATLADSATDLPEDFRDGLTSVEPTRLNQARLMSGALIRGPRFFNGIGRGAVRAVLPLNKVH